MDDAIGHANLALAVIVALGGWTVSIILATLWLSGRFRSIEVLLYKELNKHREEIDDHIRDLNNRIMMLEIKKNGWTITP